MEVKHVALKLRGKYLGIDPTPIPGKTGDDQFPVYADRTAAAAWEDVELTHEDDGTYAARFVAANRVLTIVPDGSLQSRVAGTHGVWETLRGGLVPPSDDPAILIVKADGVLHPTTLEVEVH